jgi:putative FmdB family regulatory protein
MGSTQMPTYEYACSKCGHHFEQFQSMRDEPLRKCPKCHKLALKRLIGGGAGLIFKGSGFYITDYKNKGMARPRRRASPAPRRPRPRLKSPRLPPPRNNRSMAKRKKAKGPELV